MLDATKQPPKGKRKLKKIKQNPSLWSDKNSSEANGSQGMVDMLNKEEDMVEIGSTTTREPPKKESTKFFIEGIGTWE